MSDTPIADLFRGVVYEEKPDDKSGFVYVLLLLAPELVCKIGKAKNVGLRMDAIQPLLPYRSLVLFEFWSRDALGQEAYLHSYYAEHRLWGEWFRLPLSAFFQLAELGKIMAAATWSNDGGITFDGVPDWALQKQGDWRSRLFYCATELLARLDEEFPDEGLNAWVENFRSGSPEMTEGQKQALQDRLAEWKFAKEFCCMTEGSPEPVP